MRSVFPLCFFKLFWHLKKILGGGRRGKRRYKICFDQREQTNNVSRSLGKNTDINFISSIVKLTKIAHRGEKLMQRDERGNVSSAAKKGCKDCLKWQTVMKNV